MKRQHTFLKAAIGGVAFCIAAGVCANILPEEMSSFAASVDQAWADQMKTLDPKTSVVTGCDISKSAPPVDATNNLYRMYKGRKGGWGPPGVGDAPLICGTALSGLVDKWNATGDETARRDAAKVAKGLLNLASLHGYPGFVCRGFCSDGRTTVSLSSRDQYTHWAHGLWRYATSSMMEKDSPLLPEMKARMNEVAAFMTKRVTAESGWNFGLADSPEKDYRGICTMWGADVWPHEAARLPMLYLVAYMITGEGKWRDEYERYIDEALEITLRVETLTRQKIDARMPCYALYQANASIEPIFAYESKRGSQGAARAAKALRAMQDFAKIALQRIGECNPQKPPYGMCWDGELALTVLLTPGMECAERLDAFLAESVKRRNLEKCDLCRVAHIMSVYYRALRIKSKLAQ